MAYQDQEPYIQLWLDRKKTGMIQPNKSTLTPDLAGQTQLGELMANFRKRTAIETGMLGRNQHVNQCRFGGAGNVSIDSANNVCGYGLTPPQEIAGLIGMDKLSQNDFITFNVSLVVPTKDAIELKKRKQARAKPKDPLVDGEEEKLEEEVDMKFEDFETQFDFLADQHEKFYFIEGQVDGVIKKTYPSADVLSGEGVLYEVIPVASRLSKATQDDWNGMVKDDSQNTARDAAKLTFGTLKAFEKNITSQYIPLKIGRIPLRFWVAVYNDMKTAQAILTTQYVDYEKLKEGLFAGTSSGIVSLASYPVTEVTHQKGRRIPQSSLGEPVTSQPQARSQIADDVGVQPPTQRRRRGRGSRLSI
jgi:hypothetical protein